MDIFNVNFGRRSQILPKNFARGSFPVFVAIPANWRTCPPLAGSKNRMVVADRFTSRCRK
jgi:hypothetical protein